MTSDAVEQEFEFVYAERFRHVVIGAILHGLDGGLHRAISGHHDNDSLRAPIFDPPEGVESAGPGQTEIEENGVEILEIEGSIRLFRRIGHMRSESERLCDFTAGLTD